MFYAATEGEREISIICDLFIILEITFNKQRERENRGRRRRKRKRRIHCSFQSFLHLNAIYRDVSISEGLLFLYLRQRREDGAAT